MPLRFPIHWRRPGKYATWITLGWLTVASLEAVRACVALAQNPDGTIAGPAPVIRGEQAVIIWDEAHQMEHFIRQANISTTQANIGFIVPTPQTPALVAVDPAIFSTASELAAPLPIPRTIKETPLGTLSRVLKDLSGFQVKAVYTTITSQLAVASAQPPDKGVQVISEQDVADYHATVLSADDSSTLAEWLKTNGYAWNDEDTAWLQPYIASHWKITAFRLLKNSGQNGGDGIQSRAIRMSFATNRPFFPYREPQASPEGNAATAGGRSLNVAFLSDKRMSGKLDDGKPWPGRLQYAGGLSAEYAPSQFLEEAKFDKSKEATPALSYLTYFVDDSNPRPGIADLYFSTDADQSSFRQTYVDPDLPSVYVMDWSHLASDAMAALIVGLPVVFVGFLWRQSRRARRAA